MQLELRDKKYFDERATREMAQHLDSSKRTVQGSLAYAARILAMTGQERGWPASLRPVRSGRSAIGRCISASVSTRLRRRTSSRSTRI